MLVCLFNKHCPLKHDPCCVFGSGIKTLIGLGFAVTSSISRGQTQLSMVMSVTKQVIHLPTKRAVFTVRDEQIELLVHRY